MANVKCPECKGPMKIRERRRDNAPFWGCANFPVCHGTRRYVKPGRKPKGIPNPTIQQKRIFDWVKTGTGNAIVEAVAGSGKTTTCLEAMKFTKGKVAFCCFNKHIANELQEKAPEHVDVATLHSFGLQAITKKLGRPIIRDRKVHDIIDELLPPANTAEEFTNRNDLSKCLIRLTGLVKNLLLNPRHKKKLQEVIIRYGVDMGVTPKITFQSVCEYLPEIIIRCYERTAVVDFDDMVWLPVKLKMTMEKYDWVFIDECQDLNACQIKMVTQMATKKTRIVAVGDSFQSIYGFRGADVNAVQNIADIIKPTFLPLTVTWRCPKSHVQLARCLVPHIEASPTASEGVVRGYEYKQAIEHMQPGDMVLCRVNAPIVRVAFALIARGTKAVVRGRDIGKGLISLIKRLGSDTITDLYGDLRQYVAVESNKLAKAEMKSQIEILEDKAECIYIIAEGCGSTTELIAKIEEMFSDQVHGVVCSSVHKAKGLEAETVYILDQHLMPHPRALEPWELAQEHNIEYVALTRSKMNLYFFDTPRRM